MRSSAVSLLFHAGDFTFLLEWMASFERPARYRRIAQQVTLECCCEIPTDHDTVKTRRVPGVVKSGTSFDLQLQALRLLDTRSTLPSR